MAPVPPAQRKPKKKANPLRAGQNIDYKDVATLRKFISERGKIRAAGSPGSRYKSNAGSRSPSRMLVRWRCCRTPPRPAERLTKERGWHEAHPDCRRRQARYGR